MPTIDLISFLLGAALASLAAWLVVRGRQTASDQEQQFAHLFQALSSEALQRNNSVFLDLAKTTLDKYQEGARQDLDHRQRSLGDVVKPLAESLTKVDQRIVELERERALAYGGLKQLVTDLNSGQKQLQQETSNLVNALRQPHVRGQWGEIQLRRVVEIAGMMEYCDFLEQPVAEGGNARLRPDMMVKLPNGRNIIIDSKAPLSAYLEAVSCTDEQTRSALLHTHAAHVRTHIQSLSSKQYWDQFSPTPEFVVLFLPGETFFGAALQQDTSLIEFGMERSVILATPTTLIALLKAVAYGWRHEKLSENAKMISDVGRTLYERLLTAVNHVEDIKKGLERSVDAYNKFIGSLETRVLVAARRFRDLGAATSDELPTIEPIDRIARPLSSESTEERKAL